MRWVGARLVATGVPVVLGLPRCSCPARALAAFAPYSTSDTFHRCVKFGDVVELVELFVELAVVVWGG